MRKRGRKRRDRNRGGDKYEKREKEGGRVSRKEIRRKKETHEFIIQDSRYFLRHQDGGRMDLYDLYHQSRTHERESEIDSPNYQQSADNSHHFE